MNLLWTFAGPNFLGNSWPEGQLLAQFLRTVLTQLNVRMTPSAEKRILREDRSIVQLI